MLYQYYNMFIILGPQATVFKMLILSAVKLIVIFFCTEFMLHIGHWICRIGKSL